MTVNRPEVQGKTLSFNSWRDLTPMLTSAGTTRWNKTGSWRFIKPLYEEKTAPCQNACPCGNDVEAWVKRVQEGDYEGAYWQLKREQPFPAVLGRVCFKFCEHACNRGALDESINIHALERFVGDHVPAGARHPDLPPYNGRTLAIVGSGPAGMSHAYFARLLGFRVSMFEKLDQPGGILRVGIPRYRLPRRVVDGEFASLEAMGVHLRCGMDVGRDVTLQALQGEFDYLFLATGAYASTNPPMEGADNCAHVISGLDFLKKAALDARTEPGRQVLVVGGGNTAIDAARTALRLGSRVTLVYRRTEEEMTAHHAEVEAAREEGVIFRFLAAPDRIESNSDGTIRRLVCCSMGLGEPDADGRRRPERREGATFDLAADTIITAIGEKPELAYLGDTACRNGKVPVNRALHVRDVAGGSRVFAGGDIVDIPHTVIHAVAAGKRAAIAMDCDAKGRGFAEVETRITVGRGPGLSFSAYMGWNAPSAGRRSLSKVVGPESIVFDYFRRQERVGVPLLPPDVRKENFEAYQATLTAEQARQESRRCIHCGRCTGCDNCLVFCPDLSVRVSSNGRFGYAIDYDYCKGCGICAAECPRNAITMVSEEIPIDQEES